MTVTVILTIIVMTVMVMNFVKNGAGAKETREETERDERSTAAA